MRYKVIVRNKASKNLKRIPQEFAEKIWKILFNELATNPHPPHSKIKKILEPIIGYRYKIPPYRILYQIDEKNKTIYIHKIKHRKDTYKRFGIL